MREASVTESADHVKSVQSQSQKAQQFSSVQDGVYARGKDLMRSTPFLRNFPYIAFETVPAFV